MPCTGNLSNSFPISLSDKFFFSVKAMSDILRAWCQTWPAFTEKRDERGMKRKYNREQQWCSVKEQNRTEASEFGFQQIFEFGIFVTFRIQGRSLGSWIEHDSDAHSKFCREWGCAWMSVMGVAKWLFEFIEGRRMSWYLLMVRTLLLFTAICEHLARIRTRMHSDRYWYWEWDGKVISSAAAKITLWRRTVTENPTSEGIVDEEF